MTIELLTKELTFKATRSSGAGGQHVNKVSSRVELYFDVASSEVLTKAQKHILFKKLASKINNDNTLILTCQESRSQHRNKDIVIQRFFELLKSSLRTPKIRRATKPTKASLKRKADNKQQHALKKKLRKKPKFD